MSKPVRMSLAARRTVFVLLSWTLCTGGTCHFHASTHHCKNHNNDPNHHCGHTQFAGTNVQLGPHRVLVGLDGQRNRVTRYLGIEDIRVQGAPLVAFAEEVLRSNREALGLVDAAFEFSDSLEFDRGVEVRFRTHHFGRHERGSRGSVRLYFAAGEQLVSLEVR